MEGATNIAKAMVKQFGMSEKVSERSISYLFVENFKLTEEYIDICSFFKKIPLNTKYYNNSNKYNATYAQLYKRKQGSTLESNIKKMNILLNKLSNTNLDTILDETNEIILECSEIVPKMVESIFIK